MVRGEFIRGDGLVIPNNVTIYGVRTLLAAALINEVPTFYVGLVEGEPDPALLIADCLEPTFTNGYARQQILRTDVGWPVEGTLNGQPYFESAFLTWTPSGPFSLQIQRLMLVGNATNVDADTSDKNLKVLALSTAMPTAVILDADTPLEERRFKYRLYGV